MFENLVSLEGSEAQIKWAKEIRECFIKVFSERIDDEDMPEQIKEEEIKLVQQILKVKKSCVYIDYKSSFQSFIFGNCIKNLHENLSKKGFVNEIN